MKKIYKYIAYNVKESNNNPGENICNKNTKKVRIQNV